MLLLSSAHPQHIFLRSNSIIEGRSIDSPRQKMHRASDSAFLHDSTGPYSRTLDRGPLIIPEYVMSQQEQQRQKSPSLVKSSAESLVEKVNI